MVKKKFIIWSGLIVLLILAVPAMTGLWVKSHFRDILDNLSEQGMIKFRMSGYSYGLFHANAKVVIEPNNDLAFYVNKLSKTLKKDHPIKKYLKGITLDCAIQNGPYITSAKVHNRNLAGFVVCSYNNNEVADVVFEFNNSATLNVRAININELVLSENSKLTIQQKPLTINFKRGIEVRFTQGEFGNYTLSLPKFKLAIDGASGQLSMSRSPSGIDVGEMRARIDRLKMAQLDSKLNLTVNKISSIEQYSLENGFYRVRYRLQLGDIVDEKKQVLGSGAIDVDASQLSKQAFGRLIREIRKIYISKSAYSRDGEIQKLLIEQVGDLLKGSPRLDINGKISLPDGSIEFIAHAHLDNNTKDITVLTAFSEIPKILMVNIDFKATGKLFDNSLKPAVFFFRPFFLEQISQASAKPIDSPEFKKLMNDDLALIKQLHELKLVQQQGDAYQIKFRFNKGKMRLER